MELLPLIWAGLIGFGVIMYVVLDGFTLGAGIILPYIPHKERDITMSVLLPNWDGNQTWLVLGGATLYGAFPLAFSVLLPILYLPLILMVIFLLFRGVVFEFRLKASPESRKRWDWLFIIGSVAATFIQGVVLGSFVQGFDLQQINNVYHYAWLTPFTMVTGLALICGYALLGCTRLLLKTEGELHQLMRKLAPLLIVAVAVFMFIVSVWTPFKDANIWSKWFGAELKPAIALAPVAAIGAFIVFWWGLKTKRDAVPYWSTVVMFLSGYAGLAYSVLPYIVPRQITIWQAAAPTSTLQFILPGAIIMVPLLLAYTWYSYYIFRGKVRDVVAY